MDNPDVRGWPLWRWVVLGWMATAALAAWTWNPHPPAEVLAEELEGRAPEWELAELSERELRALPAVGPARAADIVETRWRTPPEVPLVLEEVPGIGPGTAGEVRAFLERQRPVRRSPLARSSPSPRFGP